MVPVNEAGSYDLARSVIDFVCSFFNVVCRFGNLTVFYEQIHDLIQVLAGIYKSSVLN